MHIYIERISKNKSCFRRVGTLCYLRPTSLRFRIHRHCEALVRKALREQIIRAEEHFIFLEAVCKNRFRNELVCTPLAAAGRHAPVRGVVRIAAVAGRFGYVTHRGGRPRAAQRGDELARRLLARGCVKHRELGFRRGPSDRSPRLLDGRGVWRTVFSPFG